VPIILIFTGPGGKNLFAKSKGSRELRTHQTQTRTRFRRVTGELVLLLTPTAQESASMLLALADWLRKASVSVIFREPEPNPEATCTRLVLVLLACRPAGHHLPGGAPPNLNAHCGPQPPIPPLPVRAASPPSKSVSECAENGCGARVGPAVSGPHQRLVGHILCVKDGSVCRVALDLFCIHGYGAVCTSVFSIWAGNADIQSRQAMTAGTCENVCWPERCAWDQTRSLYLSRRIAMHRHIEDLPRNCVVPPRRFTEAAAVSMRARRVKKLAPAAPAWHWFSRACCAESEERPRRTGLAAKLAPCVG
jgi:hypothetical protein